MGDVVTGRVKTKCATYAQWQPVWQTFIPMKGELVVISDGVEGLPGIKVGDGIKSLYLLPYVSDVRFEDLVTVAWTGNYNDLNHKPDADDIPYDEQAHQSYTGTDNVGDAIEYLDHELSTKASIHDLPTKTSDLINDSGFITDGDIPSKTSDLINDSGFITGADVPSNETDPSVPQWAKAANKPTYTASEVGALPDSTVIPTLTSQLTNDSGFITSANIPTKTSDLTNDSGFINGSQVPSNETDPTVPSWAKSPVKPIYTAAEVGALPDTTVIPSATSDLNNDSGFITAAALPVDVSDLNNDVPYAVANNDGAALSTMAIPKGEVDSTSTATVFTATVPGISELKTGVCMMLSNHVVTSASGFTININNLGAKPVYSNMTNATRDTTIFNVAYTMLFIYDEALDSRSGGWWCYRGYNSDNNTIGYIVRSNSLQLPVDSACYRYRLLFTSMDGQHYIPANNSTSTNATAKRNTTQTPFDPFGRIIYYGYTTALSAGGKPGTAYQFEQQVFSLGYSFNRTGAALTLTEDKPVWLKAAPQSDGSVVLDAGTPFVQDLPTTEDGFVYIWLGVAYSATNIELTLQHPVKWFHDGKIRNWTGTGTVVETSVSDVSISSGSWKKLAELNLTAGTWLLLGNPRWANGSPNSGTRQMCFSTTAAQNTTHGKSVLVLSGNDTNFIGQTSSYIMRLSADSTVYLNVQQTQGGALNCSAEFQAVKL